VCELKARCTVNGIASELPMQRIGDLYCVFWQWKWMSVVIRLKVPIEMHYTVISVGTSKVNSSRRARCHSPSVRSAKWHACMLFSVNGRCTQHYFLFVHCFRCLKVTEAGISVCLDWFSQRNWGKVSGVCLNTAEYHRSPQVRSLGSHYKNRTKVTADQVQ